MSVLRGGIGSIDPRVGVVVDEVPLGEYLKRVRRVVECLVNPVSRIPMMIPDPV